MHLKRLLWSAQRTHKSVLLPAFSRNPSSVSFFSSTSCGDELTPARTNNQRANVFPILDSQCLGLAFQKNRSMDWKIEVSSETGTMARFDFSKNERKTRATAVDERKEKDVECFSDRAMNASEDVVVRSKAVDREIEDFMRKLEIAFPGPENRSIETNDEEIDESEVDRGAMECKTHLTYQPSNLVRKRRHGFLARKKTVGGRRTIIRRLAKKRRKISA